MSVDYIIASLPALAFDAPASLTWAKFAETCGGDEAVEKILGGTNWKDLETQLKNAVAEARGGEKYKRPASGCSIFWKNRILAAFQESDVARRDRLLDRVFWDAAAELTPPADPLGAGALAAYAIRLRIALKRSKISKGEGIAAFDKLTQASRLTPHDFGNDGARREA